MGGFVKLDAGILNSSLWVERDQRSLFVTALLMAEPIELTEPTPQIHVDRLEVTGWMIPPGWYGMVRAAGVGIIDKDGIDRPAGLAMLAALGAPDPDSRSSDHEGRRLVRIDGGYIVLNYFKYRDRDFGAAERMRKLRERRKHGSQPDLGPVLGEPPQPNSGSVTPNTRNVRPNVTHSREQIADSRGSKRTTTATTPPNGGRKTWLSPYLAIWQEFMPKVKAKSIAGQLAKAIRPLTDDHTELEIVEQLANYLHQVGAQFASPAGFARAFGTWTGKPANGKATTTKQERGREALARSLNREAPHGEQGDHREVPRVVPRALPHARNQRPDA